MKSSILAILAVACTVLAAPMPREARSPVDRDSLALVRSTDFVDDNDYGPDYAKYSTYGQYKRAAEDSGYGDYDKYDGYGKYGSYSSYGSYKRDESTAQN